MAKKCFRATHAAVIRRTELSLRSPEGGTLDGKPALAFVNFTGPVGNIIRDSGSRMSFRKHVMRDIGQNRRASAVSTVLQPVATKLMPTISNRSSGGVTFMLQVLDAHLPAVIILIIF
jgi:hypothetical protein